jgi:hypothetical protein
MKYQSLMFATALAFSGLASATEDDITVSSDEMTNYQVECLESALGEDLDGSQKDAFVQECVQQKLASKTKAKDKNA